MSLLEWVVWFYIMSVALFGALFDEPASYPFWQFVLICLFWPVIVYRRLRSKGPDA